MKRLVLILFFISLYLSSFSQRVYFIYLQSEAEQPFYVKMNEKIISSAAKGYLILSNLRDSSYHFSVGFAGNKSIEQKFAVSVQSKDHGYLIKNFNEKGWGLFDLQTMAVKMSLSGEEVQEVKKEAVRKDESAFARILAKASDDSTLLEKPDIAIKKVPQKDTIAKAVAVQNIPKEEEKKTEIIKEEKPIEIKKTEPVVEKNPETVITREVEKPIPVELFKKSTVTRRSESSTTEGFGVTYIDEYSNGARDTISIIIPPAKQAVAPPKEEIKEEKKFLNIEGTVKKPQIAEEEKAKQPVISNTPAIKKNTCTSIADETDFFKLRKKMAGENNDEGMIAEARKIFKSKCFNTAQIKNFSTLFLNDHGKYNFFDAAYSSVSDLENFSSLLSELKDEYYQNRFKAMLR